MAVTDLKNTTWYFNAGWEDTTAYNESISGRLYYNNSWVNLPSDTLIRIREDEIVIENSSWDNNIVFSNSQPFALDIDTYTDNTDSFVDFVNNNGIQLKVTDLTDTTWNVPAGWEADAGYGTFDIIGTINGNHDIDTTFYIGYGINENLRLVSMSNSIVDGSYYVIANANSFTISITGGTDTTNPKLIAWLSKYGELQGGEEEATPTLTYDLSQLDLPEGTHSITVVAKADGYSNSAPSNAVEYAVENAEETVSITLKGRGVSSASGNYTHPRIKFGSAPTSDGDYDYYASGYTVLITGNDEEIDTYLTPIAITTSPIAYIWQEYVDSAAGYKINDGSTITTGVGYANATQIDLNDGDAITLVATYD